MDFKVTEDNVGEFLATIHKTWVLGGDQLRLYKDLNQQIIRHPDNRRIIDLYLRQIESTHPYYSGQLQKLVSAYTSGTEPPRRYQFKDQYAGSLGTDMREWLSRPSPRIREPYEKGSISRWAVSRRWDRAAALGLVLLVMGLGGFALYKGYDGLRQSIDHYVDKIYSALDGNFDAISQKSK